MKNNTRKDRKQKLIDLGEEILAEALLDLSDHSNEADDVIERLIAAPNENIQRYKNKLASLNRSTGFIDWRGAAGFAWELERLLQDLEAGVDDPLRGVEMVAAFFEADTTIFEMCDDSDGDIGDVFRYNAKGLFVDYASRCADKEKVVEIILKVNQEDDYGVRDILIDCAGECLPEEDVRRMISTLQNRADKEEEVRNKRYHLMLIESLAKQINDAELFEKTRIASRGKPSTSAFIDIARVYLNNGDVETAHSWLKKIPEGKTFQAYERDELLREIYQKQGDSEKLSELLFKEFTYSHSEDNLQALLDVIGHEKREEIIDHEMEKILKEERLSLSDAAFLIEIGKINEAEEYLLKRSEQLDGCFYGTLVPLAETMEAENRNLAATLIYRSLLVSILKRGYSKAYHHGIDYLKKLDKISRDIQDWKNFNRHKAFKEQIQQDHGRKYSFWSKYKGKQ